MKRLFNYLKKDKNHVKFNLSCRVVHFEASSISELCDKVNNSDELKGVLTTKIVAAVVCVSTT